MSTLKLSFIIEALDRATAPIRAVHRMLESTTGPLSRVKNSWENLSGQVRGITTHFAVMGAAGAAAFYPLHKIIGEGARIQELSANLGISTRAFQRLAYALNLDGGSIEDAGNSLKFFQQNAAAAAVDGAGEMAKWFRRAGMETNWLRENINKPGSVEVMFERFADFLKSVPGAAFRLQALREVMNRSGNKLNQTMSRGARGLKEVGDEGESLGAILDDDVIKGMKEADDGMQKTARALYGLTAVIATTAIPVINKISVAIREWAKANREVTLERWTRIFAQLEASLPKIITAAEGIAVALGAVFGVMNTFAEILGGWDKLIIGLVGFKFVMLIGSVVQLGAALVGVLPAIAAIAAPLGVIVVLLAGFVAWAKVIYDNWEPISKFFTDLLGTITKVTDKLGALGTIARFTPTGLVLNAVASTIGPSSAGGSNNLGGTLKIQIDQQGRASVSELKKDSGGALDFEVYLGPYMIGAGA